MSNFSALQDTFFGPLQPFSWGTAEGLMLYVHKVSNICLCSWTYGPAGLSPVHPNAAGTQSTLLHKWFKSKFAFPCAAPQRGPGLTPEFHPGRGCWEGLKHNCTASLLLQCSVSVRDFAADLHTPLCWPAQSHIRREGITEIFVDKMHHSLDSSAISEETAQCFTFIQLR